MTAPTTKYARSGDVHAAYQMVGDGPHDLEVPGWISHVEYAWEAVLHTGECEVMNDKLSGIAVQTGARVASFAGEGEVLVSSTVKDLMAGSKIEFRERGEHVLKGVPGRWRLFAVDFV